MMSTLRISNVSPGTLPTDHLHGAHIDLPHSGATTDVFSFDVEGWALGKSAPVERIELIQEGRVLLDVPLTHARPDIASKFAGVDGAEAAGFGVCVGALGLRSRFEILVRARLRSGVRPALGTIHGEREDLHSDYDPSVQPLMINTIGRSGSTWLSWLLSCHPQIVAFKPFAHETRVATYWMTVLQELSHPQSYLTQIDPPGLAASRWWLGDAGVNRGAFRDATLREWLGQDSVRALAAIAQSRIDAFYRANTEVSDNQPYFVEKCSPWQIVPDLLSELYPRAKELILVRDFRDMFCSIRAFKQRRTNPGFGRDRAENDAQYIERFVRGFAKSLQRRSRSRGSSVKIVRYEDLVLDPVATLTALLAYLDVDSSDAVVEETLRRAENPTGAKQHQTAKNPAASIGRWHDDLSDDLKATCDEALGPVLAEFGYEPSAQPASERA